MGVAPSVGRIWPWSTVGTTAQNPPCATISASSLFDRLKAAAAIALARDVSGVKKPVPSPRALSTSRPASSTTVTVIGDPSALAFSCAARTAVSATWSVNWIIANLSSLSRVLAAACRALIGSLLRVEAADLVRVGDAPDTFHQRGGAEVHVVLLRGVPHPCKRTGHDLLQAGDDLGFLPEVELEALDPLEVGSDDAARVGKNVGDDEDAAVAEDLVRLGSGRAIGALDDDARVDPVGIVLTDLGARGR